MTDTKSKIFIAVILGLFTIFSIALVIPNDDSSTPSTPSSGEDLSFVSESDPKLTFGETKVTLIEYSDLECPACSYVSKNIIKPVLDEEIEGLQFVFKHFPLQSIHPSAVSAAIASESALRQGKFFEMKELLFETQEEWSNSSDPNQEYIKYATALGLDVPKFEQDLKDPALRTKILDAYEFAKNNGLNSTPTLILNGEKIKASTPEELKSLILSAISEN